MLTIFYRRRVQREQRLQHPQGALLPPHQEAEDAAQEGRDTHRYSDLMIMSYLLQLCTYFTDADVCIGPVASHQVQLYNDKVKEPNFIKLH